MVLHPLRAHIEALVPLSDEEFEEVLSHFEVVRKRKHQYVIEADTYIDHEYWVHQGCLKASFFDRNAKEYILQFAMEDWWITDYAAFQNQTKSQVAVICLEDCELFRISYENKEKLRSKLHKMERFWSKKTDVGYVALQQRILVLLNSTPKERYELLFEQYPSLFQRVPKKMIAAYLGVSRETLSRLYT